MSLPLSTTSQLFDAHAHLVADDQVRYPRNPMPRPTHAPPRRPGVIGEPGGKAGPNPVHEVPDASRMRRWIAEENVAGIVAVQKRMIYRLDNSYILDSADAHVGVFFAMVILDAEDPGTPDVIAQYVQRHGLVGVRLFGVRPPDGRMPWLDSPEALRTWDAMDRFGVPMDIEVIAIGGGGPAVPNLVALARRYPRLPIVLDHVLDPEVTEGPHFGIDERFEALASEPNIHVKFTTINLDVCRESDVPAEQVLRRTVDVFGADRVMWGSDIGTSSGTYREMVQRMLDATALLSPAESRAVLHDTGARLFARR